MNNLLSLLTGTVLAGRGGRPAQRRPDPSAAPRAAKPELDGWARPQIPAAGTAGAGLLSATIHGTPLTHAAGGRGESVMPVGEAWPPATVLLAFAAECEGRAAVLHWSTARERRGDWFEVEAAADGHPFVVVATVAGCGAATGHTSYHLTDTFLPAYGTPRVAYRLRHRSHEGTMSVSAEHVVPAPAGPAASLHLYLGARRLVRYGYRGPALPPDAVLEVHDAAGRRVSRQSGAVAGVLATAHLAPGWYRASLRTAFGQLQADFQQI